MCVVSRDDLRELLCSNRVWGEGLGDLFGVREDARAVPRACLARPFVVAPGPVGDSCTGDVSAWTFDVMRGVVTGVVSVCAIRLLGEHVTGVTDGLFGVTGAGKFVDRAGLANVRPWWFFVSKDTVHFVGFRGG